MSQRSLWRVQPYICQYFHFYAGFNLKTKPKPNRFWALAFLISYQIHTNIYVPILNVGPTCAGIACTMITFRVGMRQDDKVYISTNLLTGQMQIPHVQDLRFSSNQASPTRST